MFCKITNSNTNFNYTDNIAIVFFVSQSYSYFMQTMRGTNFYYYMFISLSVINDNKLYYLNNYWNIIIIYET